MKPDPSQLPQAADITALHDKLLTVGGWPHAEAQPADVARAASVWAWIEANHRFNSLLWAEEDLARRTTVADTEIAANKRAIDGHNQARNDATERIDELLLSRLHGPDTALSSVPSGARLHSETAGAMVDRLSIMALKRHAMKKQTERTDAGQDHVDASRVKLARLNLQRADLAACLDALLADAVAGRAYFKLYRQFKMYNDPQFNPALVAERAEQAAQDQRGV